MKNKNIPLNERIIFALDLNSKDEVAWTNLGSSYFNLGQYDNAIKSLNNALDIVPGLEFAETILKLTLEAKEHKY